MSLVVGAMRGSGDEAVVAYYSCLRVSVVPSRFTQTGSTVSGQPRYELRKLASQTGAAPLSPAVLPLDETVRPSGFRLAIGLAGWVSLLDLSSIQGTHRHTTARLPKDFAWYQYAARMALSQENTPRYQAPWQ